MSEHKPLRMRPPKRDGVRLAAWAVEHVSAHGKILSHDERVALTVETYGWALTWHRLHGAWPLYDDLRQALRDRNART